MKKIKMPTSINNLRSKINLRGLISMLLLLSLIIMVYLSYGGSIPGIYSNTDSSVTTKEHPGEVNYPNLTNKINISQGDFSNFPSNFPTNFPTNGFNGFNFTNTQFPDISLPGISFPNGTFPTVSFPTPTQPTVQSPQTFTVSPNNSTDQNSNNSTTVSYNKARFLPKIKPIPILNISIKIDMGEYLDVNPGLNGYILITLLFALLFLSNYYIPLILEYFENDISENNTEENEFFIVSKKQNNINKNKKERMQRLVRFRDHVNVIIKRCEDRKSNPSEMIILAYHELDAAFSEFSKLSRDKNLTPLEHSKLHFTTGEINNDVLEQIVYYFYMARFGHKKIDKKSAEEFITLLKELVYSIPEEEK